MNREEAMAKLVPGAKFVGMCSSTVFEVVKVTSMAVYTSCVEDGQRRSGISGKDDFCAAIMDGRIMFV